MYLSASTLRMVHSARQQVLDQLQRGGFAPRTRNDGNAAWRRLNRNGRNMALIKGVVCGGLYPCIARRPMWPLPGASSRNLLTRELHKRNQKVRVHPHSVLAKAEMSAEKAEREWEVRTRRHTGRHPP